MASLPTDSGLSAEADDRPSKAVVHTGAARGFSLASAGLISSVLTVFPGAIIQAGKAPDHGILVLCLLGVAGGFVHGVGFVPRSRLFRVLFHPLLAWLLMFGGLLAMIRV